MSLRRLSVVGFALFTLPAFAACSSSASPTGSGQQPDQIAPEDDPTSLLDDVSMRLADNLGTDDIGKTFGVADDAIPYPDTYWPFTEGGTDAQWGDSGSKTPIEKLMAVSDPSNVAQAKAWEKKNHGPDVPNVAGWWGHCPGWTGAALSNKPILHPVLAKAGPDGKLVACDEGSTGCVKFEIADINALEAEVFVDGNSRFIGNRCDTKPSDIKRDANGRIVRDGNGCQGLNAGSLVVVLGTQMKKHHKGLAIDAQNDFNTDQIWNQPAYRYTVNRYEPLTEKQAANLVGSGSRDGALEKYQWDDAAKGFAFVDFTIDWVSERGPNTTVVSGLDSTRHTRMVAVLELDAAASDPAANILGGEYLDDASVGADRLTVPPFVWVSIGAGPEKVSHPSGNTHNPFVKPSFVEQLIAFGTK